MIKLSDIIDTRCVSLALTSSAKDAAIEELVTLLANAGKVGDASVCLTEVLEREKISSTGIGQGIAIPHRLIAGVNNITMAIGRSIGGVPFDSVDGKPAHLIFLIVGKVGQNNEYLKVLSTLSRHLNDRAFFESLMRVGDVGGLIGLFEERERKFY